MTGAGIGRRRAAGRDAVTKAIAVMTEVGAAAHHPCAAVQGTLRVIKGRVHVITWMEPVGTPFPGIADHLSLIHI